MQLSDNEVIKKTDYEIKTLLMIDIMCHCHDNFMAKSCFNGEKKFIHKFKNQ